MFISSVAASALTLLACASSALAVGTPLGFGSATRGGGSATAQTPSSPSQLASWLADSTPRVIVLNKLYDFSNYYGTASGKVCYPWTCSKSTAQSAIDQNNWCENYQSSAKTGSDTWNKAGTAYQYSLKVGSQKTLLGKGSSAGITGIGLLIQNSQHVIIQNIQISDINAKFVWGGDAIAIVGSTNVWIDHNLIKNTGRQFIATGYDSATGVTISNNVFDGRSPYSVTCNGAHYWGFIFTGKADTITFAQNHIYMTSGRGPHIGGTSGYTQYVHVVNNYYDNVPGHAMESDVGAVAFVEGNYFNAVTTPDLTGGDSTGPEWFVQSGDVSSCTSNLGRTCVANSLTGSGSVKTRTVSSVLSALKAQSAVKNYSPMSAQAAATYVQNNAGLGKVN